MVSADICLTNADCDSDSACVTSGTENLNFCIVCEDTDGENYYVKGISAGVQYIGLDYSFETDYCNSENELIEFYCTDLIPDYTAQAYKTIDCSDENKGYICSDGACIKRTITTDKPSSKTKLGATEYVSSSPLPWILGGVGVLLLSGVAFWYFRGTKPSKKRKK